MQNYDIIGAKVSEEKQQIFFSSLNKNSVNRYLRFKFKSLAMAYSGSLILIVVRCVYGIC
jgi:hypothetical protein